MTFSIIAAVSALLFTETTPRMLWKGMRAFFKWLFAGFKIRKNVNSAVITSDAALSAPLPPPRFPTAKKPAPLPPEPAPKMPKERARSKREQAIEAQRVANGDYAHFKLPPPSLLNNPKKVDQASLNRELQQQAARLEETLKSFGIEAKVGAIHCGPTITSFEVHPPVGVKVQKIKTLENDIALNLQAASIRIIAPIPGKAAVGVEIPSPIAQEVSFKELLIHYQERKQKAQIPILLGKTVSGEMVMSDLAKMPHCIIAGATGSGKSVCINTIVMSIVMNAKPDEVKLLMVDPKKVELTGYANLPHMIAPVITEAHGAYAALSWMVREMQHRYEILKHLGLRNIAAFNGRKRDVAFEESLDLEIPETMPKIVGIIDEFADLMMASSSDLETPIARIAQMARAVGIHLILATQRPSREVITGIIKANFPTRISFKVASRVNSQIILDETGAESLLGNGDMLFLPPGSSQLMRAQGTYISDEEINQIVSYICNQAPPNYLISSFDAMPKEDLNSLAGIADESKDSLYEDALCTVVETGTASTTFLQRKLKIGYARAASLMDELERNGVISAQEGAKPRRVLLNSSNAEG
jgi:DNA segregation ATPase FtsK/SpoIIIE, S-DNA-T family